MWTRRKWLLSSSAVMAGALTANAQPSADTALTAEAKLNPLSEAPDWSGLKSLAETMTRADFELAMTKVYGSGSPFPAPWTVGAERLSVQTKPGQGNAEIIFAPNPQSLKKGNRYWRKASELTPLDDGKGPLSGLHIALDPGHIGGAYAQMEERWLSMDSGQTVVMEGSIVLQVANLLRPRLEALGAQVSFVRSQDAPVTTAKLEDFHGLARKILEEAGITNPPETYTDRLDDRRIISVQWQAEKLFYRVSEIRARAHRVNHDLRPDLVLCLHLNAEPWGDPKNPEFVEKNHMHLLVNGCYAPEELQYEDTRFEMLNRVFNHTHVEELALADTVATALAATTKLAPYVYNTQNARRVSDNAYVYARNLLANRLYQCPVLYFEPYVMNHEMTYKRLVLGHYIGRTLVSQELVTSPLEDYTRGVLRGLEAYYRRTRATT